MSEEFEVLRMVTARLNAAAIPYMMTGSMAVNYYAVPRMTRDIDIVVEFSELDVDRILELFQDDFYIEREAVQMAILERTQFNIIHYAFVIKVDFVIRKESEYRLGEFSRRKQIVVDDHEIYIVPPEDLILSKLEWAKQLGLESLYHEAGG